MPVSGHKTHFGYRTAQDTEVVLPKKLTEGNAKLAMCGGNLFY